MQGSSTSPTPRVEIINFQGDTMPQYDQLSQQYEQDGLNNPFHDAGDPFSDRVNQGYYDDYAMDPSYDQQSQYSQSEHDDS